MSTFTLTASTLEDKRYSRILSEGLEKFQSEKKTFTSYFFDRVVTSDKGARDTSISTVEQMFPLSEAQVAPIVSITQGFESFVPWIKFGVARETTWETRKTNDSGDVERLAKEKVNTIARTEDLYAGRIFRQAFNPSFPTASGSPLISASLPLRNGNTQTNTLSSQLPLSYDTLGQLTDVMRAMRDHSGNRINTSTKLTLMVPNIQGVRELAFQLVGKNGAMMKPGGNNNDSNFYQKYEGFDYNLIVVNCIDSVSATTIGETASSANTSWFLIDEGMLMEKKYLVMPMLKESDSLIKAIETESLSMKQLVYHYMGFGVRAGFSGWIAGSKGDNSASNF